MNTLPYIHANPKAANIQSRFFHDFSNYDTYQRLTNDGLTKWHPAFFSLGKTLDKCAKNIGVFARDTNLDPNQKSPIDGVVGFCPR